MYLLIFAFAVISQSLITAVTLRPLEETYQASNQQAQDRQHHGFDFQNQQQHDQGHQENFQHQGFQGQQSVYSGYNDGQQDGHSSFGDAKILNYQLDTDEHNNYQYAFETDNGIKIQEVGYNSEEGTKMQGAYSYTGDDGKIYTVTYTADETGFHPHGAHIPTPPPMPEDIARSVDFNLKAEANGIIDDGQYHNEQYSEQSEIKPQISVSAIQNHHQPIQNQEQPIQNQQLRLLQNQQLIQNHQQRPLQNQPQRLVQNHQPRPLQNHQTSKQQPLPQKHAIPHIQRPQHISFSDQQLQQSQSHRSVQHSQNQNVAVNNLPAGEVFESTGQLQNINQPITQNNQNIGQLKNLHQSIGNLKTRHQLKTQNQPLRLLQNYQHLKQQQQQAIHSQQQVQQSSQQQNHYVPVHSQKPHVEEQHRVEYIFPTIKNVLTQEPHKVEYVPAPQNSITEERHKVEYHVPSMKHLGLLQQIQAQKEHRQVLYQAPTFTQLKHARDYIGPAPVAEKQYE